MTNNHRIAVVVSRFNETITDPLLAGCLARLAEQGLSEAQITVAKVPGAIELPLMAKHYARSGRYGAIICLGAVIRGETTHYDVVCQQASQGCQTVSLQYHVPVIFGVLTTETVAQAHARVGGAHGHKGRYAADAALEMMALLQAE